MSRYIYIYTLAYIIYKQCVYECMCVNVCVWMYVCECMCVNVCVSQSLEYMYVWQLSTRWWRPIGCLNSRVTFRKRASNYRALLQWVTYNYRALLQWVTYKNKATYECSPPSMCVSQTTTVHVEKKSICVYVERVCVCRTGVCVSQTTKLYVLNAYV